MQECVCISFMSPFARFSANELAVLSRLNDQREVLIFIASSIFHSLFVLFLPRLLMVLCFEDIAK